MSSRRPFFFFLLVMLAGCSTTRRQPPPDVMVMPEHQTLTAEPKPLVPTNLPPPPVLVPTNLPPTNQLTNPVVHIETWVPLDRWCQSNGYGGFRRTATQTGFAYSFVSSNSQVNGTMIVRIGSQIASWRGMEYRLGFAPVFFNGHPFVHSLDIRKNFLPLLETPLRARNDFVIVIDPGHGGTDTGAKSVYNGHTEKEYTLDVARRLQSLLSSNGVTVWLTRTNDVFVPLERRVEIADEHQADFFLSLHFNSISPDTEAAGLETFCLTPKGMPSNETRGYKDDWLLAFPNNQFDRENVQYAARLHRAVLKVNGHADRGVERARFIKVVREQNRPAVLMEGGFLSNPREARRIADPAYRQKMAEALAQGLLENLGEMPGVTNQPSTNAIGTNTPVMTTNFTRAPEKPKIGKHEVEND